MIPAGIPSPSHGVWYLGPIPLRVYGIIIVTGMIIAVWWGSKRYVKRGGNPDVLYDITLWAVPLGIVGARVYHVITTPYSYFGEGRDPLAALRIWEGGLGIWGGVAFGVIGALIAVKRGGVRLGPIADSIAPTILLAQAIGRWGNYFNQELFGGPTSLPWGLQIDDAHLPIGFASGTLFHPTFLYESLWNITMALLIVWIDRKWTLKSGQVFALYLIAYPLGRSWIEMIRIDAARSYFGVRLNTWTSLGVLVIGVVVFIIAGRIGRSTTLLEDERFTPDDQDKVESDPVEGDVAAASDDIDATENGNDHDSDAALADSTSSTSR